MKTYKRIDAISQAVLMAKKEFFDKEILVADIATDHGYIAENLSKQDFCKGVIATDISAKSLSKLENMIKNRGLEHINCVLGDGLEPIEHVDIAVIAGIGGYEIIKMLDDQNMTDDGKRKCNVFVLQPAQNVLELREFIFKNKIYLLKDFVIFDEGRFYPILIIDLSKKQKNRANIYNIWLGRDNKISDYDFKKFLIEVKDFLGFLDEIDKKRIRQDDMLKQKYKLKKLACKLLKI